MKFKINKNSLDFLKSFEDEDISFVKITAKENKITVEIIKNDNSIEYLINAKVEETGSVFIVLNKFVGFLHQFDDEITVETNTTPEKDFIQLFGKDGDIKISFDINCWEKPSEKIVESLADKSRIICNIKDEAIQKTITNFIKKVGSSLGIGFSASGDLYITDGSYSYANKPLDSIYYFGAGKKFLLDCILNEPIENIFVSEEVIEFKFPSCSIFVRCDRIDNPYITNSL